jgi:hypothetical protein
VEATRVKILKFGAEGWRIELEASQTFCNECVLWISMFQRFVESERTPRVDVDVGSQRESPVRVDGSNFRRGTIAIELSLGKLLSRTVEVKVTSCYQPLDNSTTKSPHGTCLASRSFSINHIIHILKATSSAYGTMRPKPRLSKLRRNERL